MCCLIDSHATEVPLVVLVTFYSSFVVPLFSLHPPPAELGLSRTQHTFRHTHHANPCSSSPSSPGQDSQTVSYQLVGEDSNGISKVRPRLILGFLFPSLYARIPKGALVHFSEEDTQNTTNDSSELINNRDVGPGRAARTTPSCLPA